MAAFRRSLALAFAALLLSAGIAAAQIVSGTPTNPLPAPPQAEEIELEKALTGGRVAGRISIPDARAASLIQPAGKDWRDFHNETLTLVGGVAVLGMLALLAFFWIAKGRIRIDRGASGRWVQRFGFLERANHWMVASSFIVLGLSGLNLTFGRHLLLPLVGPETFAEVTIWGKVAHNYLSFPFTLGIVVMLLIWVRDNIPNRLDLVWIRAGGGFLSGGHPPAGRFNAGQKMVFWITVLGGAIVAASGYILIFPFAVTDIAGMQTAHIVHGVLALLMVAAMLAHIYIGSLGMEGAFDAMGTGRVDYNWAKEHHSLWLEEEVTRVSRDFGRAAGRGGDARAAGAD